METENKLCSARRLPFWESLFVDAWLFISGFAITPTNRHQLVGTMLPFWQTYCQRVNDYLSMPRKTSPLPRNSREGHAELSTTEGR